MDGIMNQRTRVFSGLCTDILQLNNQDLGRFLRQKELENPLIELKGNHTAGRGTEKSDLQRKLRWLDDMDEQNRIYYEADLEDEETRDEWNIPVEEESLAEFVYAQLSSSCTSARDEEILFFLANSLDSRGYLKEPLDTLKKMFGLKDAEAYRYLYMLQSVEPAGIGAMNLVECLLLQLERMEEPNTVARQIVIECLELLGDNQIRKIAARLGISVEETERNAALIRSLNPKPGSGFSSRENLKYVLPDVTVVKFQDYFQVMLNDTAYPQIRLNRRYMQMMESDEVAEETKEYIRQQIMNASEVTEGIAERGHILTEVTKAIVELQRGFFEKGPGNRHEMTREALAAHLGMDEAVIVQAVQDKYIQCSWGVYPLQFFFVQPPNRTSKPAGSSETVKERICEIIAGENKTQPLSDQKITEQLNSAGIRISRRTVAKYRAAMEIPEANRRREWSV